MLSELERYREMVENSQDWFWEFDENAYFTYVSPSIKSMLGYEPEEVIGLNAFDLMSPDEAKRVRRHFDPIAEKYLPFINLENVNVHKDGHEVIIESSGTPIFDKTGKFCGYRGIDRDITKRKKLMDEVKRTAQLAALGTVAAGVAHEINNPIQGILNYATLIHQSPERVDRAKDLSERIVQECERIAIITKDLLYYSKENVVDMIISDINDSIDSALTLMETKVRRQGIRIEKNLSKDLPMIKNQPQAIRQAVINLVDNSYDALRIKDIPTDEKVITVSTGRLVTAEQDNIYIEVHDNGAGMDKAARLRAKEVFYTTKPASQGTGLGLSIVNDIVINHSGKLEIDSKENEYSNIRISLPVNLPPKGLR